MSQVFNEDAVQKYSKLLQDPIGSMLQTFQNLSDEDGQSFPACGLPKMDIYDPSKIPCLTYETLNKCPKEDCEFFHGQRCPHCCENVLPMWNSALREGHTSVCRVKIQDLKRMKRYEQQRSSWLHCRTEDDRRNWMHRNQQWY